MLNVKLLKEVRTQIVHDLERETEKTDMGCWRGADIARCQTTLCAAGWAAELAGGKWVMSDKELIESWATSEHDYEYVHADALHAVPEDAAHEVNSRGYIHAENRARRVLGLTRDQADELFYSGSEGVLDALDSLIEEGEEQERAAAGVRQ